MDELLGLRFCCQCGFPNAAYRDPSLQVEVCMQCGHGGCTGCINYVFEAMEVQQPNGEANHASNSAPGTNAPNGVPGPNSVPAQNVDANNETSEEERIRHTVEWSNSLPTIPGTDAIDFTAWSEQSRQL